MQDATTRAPERTQLQRQIALLRANEVRYHRARTVKPTLKNGTRTLHDVFADELCHSMRVMDVLVSLPKVGRVKANKVLSTARISPSKTVGGMTERQRVELIVQLGSFPSVLAAVRDRAVEL